MAGDIDVDFVPRTSRLTGAYGLGSARGHPGSWTRAATSPSCRRRARRTIPRAVANRDSFRSPNSRPFAENTTAKTRPTTANSFLPHGRIAAKHRSGAAIKWLVYSCPPDIQTQMVITRRQIGRNRQFFGDVSGWKMCVGQRPDRGLQFTVASGQLFQTNFLRNDFTVFTLVICSAAVRPTTTSPGTVSTVETGVSIPTPRAQSADPDWRGPAVSHATPRRHGRWNRVLHPNAPEHC